MGLGAAGSGGGSPPSRGRGLAAEGCTSTGATMSVVAHRLASVSGCCRCSCGGGHGNCVNIYVNSNVQGVTNSVLVGSKVVMRDPGPRIVSSRRHQPRRDGSRRREGKRTRQRHMAKTTKVGIVVAVVSLLFVAAAAAAVLYLYLFVRVRK